MSFIGRQKFKATLRAIRYLKRVETPDARISSARSDYDTYWIYLKHPEKSKEDPLAEEGGGCIYARYCVLGADDDKLIIQETMSNEGDKPNPKKNVNNEFVESSTFEITHYYKEQNFTFRSPLCAALFRFLRIYKPWWLTNYVLRSLFGLYASIFVRQVKQRYKVIDVVIAMEDEGRSEVSLIEIGRRLHGHHYFSAGPEKIRAIHRQLSRFLDSLVESGELRRTGICYSTTPVAVISSIQWKREIKQTNHRFIMDVSMVVFTGFLAAFTAILAINS